MNKENDWIIANINNPEFTVDDFRSVAGMNISNTQLLTKDQYSQSKYITQNPQFQSDGKYSQKLFDDFYAKQVQRFGEFYAEDTTDAFEYNMWDVTRPKGAKIKNPNFQMVKLPNPDHISIGIGGPNVVSESEYSRRELAQRSKIYDSKTGKYLDKSVNDISFTESPLEYFKSIFDGPLVYATYNENGTHIDPYTKQEVEHKKGDWRLNEDGQYYTETLNGESVVGKEVVSIGDYVTPENSVLNKYDFFDVDGLDKSVTGTIVKNLATVAPLIFLGPTGVMIYGGLFAARELVKTLPMLNGMFQSFTGQEVTDSKLLNTLSGYGNMFTGSTSDYAKNNTFAAENFINLAGEVALQWGQQKAIVDGYAKLMAGNKNIMNAAHGKALEKYLSESIKALEKGMTGKMAGAKVMENVGAVSYEGMQDLVLSGKWAETIYGRNALDMFIPAAKSAMESRIKMGQDLSLVYMSLISNTDVYDSVKESGGTDFEAAAIALGSAIGMFAVDKYLGLGEMFFEKDAVRQSFRSGWKREAENIVSVLRQDVGKAAVTEAERNSKKRLTNLIGSSIEKAKNYVKNYHSKIKDHTLGFVGKSIGEGLEEVSEELVADSSKAIGALLGKLGVFSQTDYGAFENPFERYIMSFLGGSVGGGLFYGVEAYQKRNDPKIEEGENELIWLIRNHKKEDLMKELDSLHKKGKLGSTDLSWQTAKGEDGQFYFVTADNNNISQNDYVYQRLKEIYNHIDVIVNNNKVGLSDEELFQNMILSDNRLNALRDYLEDKSYSTRYQEEFHKIAKGLVDIDLAIEQHIKTTDDPSKRNNLLYEEKLKELQDKKKELQDKRDKFLSGEMSLPYIKKMLFAIDPEISGNFLSVTLNQFSRVNFGKSYSELAPAQQEAVLKAYEEYKAKDKMNLDQAFEAYEKMEQKLLPEISSLSELDAKAELDRFKEVLKKDVPNQYLTWDSKLENESDEEFKNRDTQLEGESDENFKSRKEQREADIKAYNDSHLAEYVKNFADMGLDQPNFRLAHLTLRHRRKDVVDAILKGFKYGETDPEDNGKVINEDVEVTETVRNLLKSGNSLERILEDLATHIKDIQEKQIKARYKEALKASEAYAFLKEEGFVETLSESDKLTLAQVIEGIKNFSNIMGSQEDAFNELADMGLSKNSIEKLKNILEFEEHLSQAEALQNQLRQKVLADMQADGRLDLVNPDMDLVEQETTSQMDITLRQLQAELVKVYEDEIPEDVKKDLLDESKQTLTLEEIQAYNELFKKGVVEVTYQDLQTMIGDSSNTILQQLNPAVENIYNELQNNAHLKAFDSLEKNLYKNNPALQFLSKITTKLGNTEVAVDELLQELHQQYQNIDDFRDFKLSEEQKNALKAVLQNISIARGFLRAASKDTSHDSPIGQNKAVNEFIKNHPDVFSQEQLLPEISQELGGFLALELDSYEREINVWLNLVETTRVDKVSMFQQSEIALDKALKAFYGSRRDGFKIKGVDLLEGYTNETSVLDTERLLYNNVQKALKDRNLTLQDVFSIIPKLVTDPQNIALQIPSQLDHNLETLNDYDVFTYFITTISLPIDSYRSTVKNFIKNNENIVPISVQLYASRIQQAIQQNPEYVNKALEWVTGQFSIKLPWLPNTAILTGVGGAGKSEVGGRIADPNQGRDTWVSGPTKTQIDALISPESDKLSKATGIEIDALLEKIIGASNVTELNKDIQSKNDKSNFYSKSKGLDDTNTFILKEIKFQDVKDLPKIILIDEATHIPGIKLQIISQFAKKNNIHLLLLGDNCQSGFSNGFMNNIDRESIFAWRTPKLYLSLRDSTVQKYYNQQGLLQILEPLLNSSGETQEKVAVEKALKEGLPKFKFRYYLKETFSGEMITDSVNPEVIKVLKNNVDEQGKQKKVAFLGKPEDSETYKKLTEAGVELEIFSNIEDIQGREFDYVVSDLEWKIDLTDISAYHLSIFLQKLYTTISRSKKGTIIIDHHLSETIQDKQDQLTGPATDIRASIKEFKEKALEGLSDVPDQASEIAPIQEETTPESQEESQPSTPESTPTPEPAPENNSETPAIEPPIQPEVVNIEEVLGKKELEEDTPQENDNSAEAVEEQVEAEIEEKEFEQDTDHPFRCYTNIHIINATISQDDNGDDVWTGNGSNRDISIFLEQGKSISSAEDKDAYVKKVLQLKSLLVYGSEYWDRVEDRQILEMFGKDSFNNVEYYIVAENADDSTNKLMGLSNLKNEKRTVLGKVLTIVANIKGKDGKTYQITIGGVANPDTWQGYIDSINSNSNADEKDKKWAKELEQKQIIAQYKNTLQNIIDTGKPRKVSINPSTLTTLISEDGDGNPNPEVRLQDLNTQRRPFDNMTKYAVRSKVYTLIEDVPWARKKLKGKPIIFVSSNIFLKPDELIELYKRQKNGTGEYGVRMIILSNKGVEFKSLYKNKWVPIYNIQGKNITMPFNVLGMGIKMYSQMWNFRANLQKFANTLKDWKQNPKSFTPNATVDSLSDDDVLELIKTDREAYNAAVEANGGKYVSEAEYRNSVPDKSKLQLLWDFNDNLANSVRQFRLGYDTNNGAYIRTLTNIKEDNLFYSDRLEKGQRINGIYIMPDTAKKYLDTLDTLFNNVIDKIIPTDRDPLAWIDISKTFEDESEENNWFRDKLQDNSSIQIIQQDDTGKEEQGVIEFKNEKNLSFIPLAMTLVAKYITRRQNNVEVYDSIYEESLEDFELDPEHSGFNLIKLIDPKTGEQTILDYISIAKTLGLQQTDLDGLYTQGLGLKPVKVVDGVSTGTVDRNLDNLFSLMFHGLVELTNENNFDNPGDLRATDAYFKYGLFSDPFAYYSSGMETFLQIATNEALFSTNLLPGYPIVTFQFINEDSSTKEEIAPQPTPVQPQVDQLQTLKNNIIILASENDLSISEETLSKFNSEKELVDYVNSLLNPKFAQGENADLIRKRSTIYKYFLNEDSGNISDLIDHIEIVNGQIIKHSVQLGIDIASENRFETGEKIVTDTTGKKFKIQLNSATGEIEVVSLSKVDLRSEDNTVVIQPTYDNIKFTINSYFDELLNSIDDTYAEELRDLIIEAFEGTEDDPSLPGDETISDITSRIAKTLQKEFYFTDLPGWAENIDKLVSDILPNIVAEGKLRQGCI